MKVRLILSIFLMITLIPFGTASASGRGDGLNYLALGDSATFGYISQAGYEYFYPTNFVSYADYLSSTFNLNTVDAACPGETTSSFISPTATDNGCRAYRSNFPLHVNYGQPSLLLRWLFSARIAAPDW